jgi:hypothetical protein
VPSPRLPRLVALAVGLAVAAAPAVATSPAVVPHAGRWVGTAVEQGRSAPLTFDVVRRPAGREIRLLRTRTTDTCVSPGPEPATTTTIHPSVAVDRVRVRRGRFALADGDVGITGRFTSPERVAGTIEVAAEGLTCAGSTLTFRARKR